MQKDALLVQNVLDFARFGLAIKMLGAPACTSQLSAFTIL